MFVTSQFLGFLNFRNSNSVLKGKEFKKGFLRGQNNTVSGGIVPAGKVWTALGPRLKETGMSVNGFVSLNKVFFMKAYYLRYNLHIIVPTDVSFSISKNFCKINFLLILSTEQSSDLSIGRVQLPLRGSRRHDLLCLSLRHQFQFAAFMAPTLCLGKKQRQSKSSCRQANGCIRC